MTDKASHELDVFVEFAQAHGIEATAEDVSQGAPPEPDILCSGTYYELGRIVDRESISAVSRAQRGLRTTYRHHLVAAPSEVRILDEKLNSEYRVEGKPVELVLYWDWDEMRPITAHEPPFGPHTFVDLLGPVISRTLSRQSARFRAVHYFHRRTGRVLASFAASNSPPPTE